MEKLTRVRLYWFLILTALTAVGGCGDDPVKPTDPPRITAFSATPSDIMPGDSSLLSYTVAGADSLRLLPDGVRLSPASSGSRWVKPDVPTLYSLISYNKGGRDSAAAYVSMNGAVPNILAFDLLRDTLLIGDSTALIWRTERADSIKIDGGAAHLADVDSGGVVVKPSSSQTFRAIAYNNIGTDTSTTALRIEVPYEVVAINGGYYRGTIGDNIDQPPLEFQIRDQTGLALRLPRLYFSLVEGDGTLSADSALPNASGIVSNDLLFGGQKGYGLIRAFVPGYDTLDVIARASVIRFGTDGQGQYVRLYDTYADVVGLNGPPAKIDQDPRPGYEDILYADYEVAKGMVAVLFDYNNDNVANDTDLVVEVFLNTVYTGVTPEGIGVGSGISAIRVAYGTPDALYPDPDDPATTLRMIYNDLGVLFYLSKVTADSAVYEIHLSDPALKAGMGPGTLRGPLDYDRAASGR